MNSCARILATLLIILLAGLPVNALTQTLPGQTGAKLAEAAQPAPVPERLTDAQIDSLLSGLTDAQARALLKAQLKSVGGEDSGGTTEGGDIVAFIKHKPDLIMKAAHRWLELVQDTPRRVSRGIDRFTAGEGAGKFFVVLATIVGLLLVAGVVNWVFDRLILKVRIRLREQPVSSAAARCGRIIAVAAMDALSLGVFVAAAYILIEAVLPAEPAPDRDLAINLAAIVVIVRGIGIASRMILAPYIPNIRIANLTDEAAMWSYRWIERVVLALSIPVVIQALITHLHLGAGGFRPMADTFFATLVLAAILHGIWARREPVARWMRGQGRLYKGSSGDADAGLLSTQFAAVWHILATIYVVIVFLWFFVSALTGAPVRPSGVILSVLIIPAVPILDSAARRIVESLVLAGERKRRRREAAERIILPDEAEDRPQPEEGADGVNAAEDDKITGYHPLAYVAHRIFRVALVIVSLIAFLRVWGFDAVASVQSTMAATTAKSLVRFAVALGIGYVVWEFINAFTRPHMPDDTPAIMDEGGGKATHNRIETLLPLIRATLLTALVIMVAMIALSSFGVDIGPLLAGAGVVGIALGFGAQKLVADVISGIFFLIDDAFRVGEYVDTGQVKGTVEKISVRSLQLRHHRGALHTIPFGEIRHLTNYHRDWAIVKMEFRVPYDTDIEKVRKIIKKEGQSMFDDPVFGEHMLAPLKSQGVARMEDSAMIIRTKFTAVPGEQFVIRREAYRRIQEALHNNGIQFAQRRVTVELASGEELDTTNDTDGSRVAAAAAGGAALAAQAAEEGAPAAPVDSR